MNRILIPVLVLGSLAALLAGVVFLWQSPQETIFVVSAVGSVVGAIVAVTRKNPIYAIVTLLVVFLCMALQFWVLEATLLAALQLIVYAGAILMLFLFVIMLFNLDSADPAKELGEMDVTTRPTADEAEREGTGVAINTPRLRAAALSIAVFVLMVIPITMTSGEEWDRFLPIVAPITADIDDQARDRVIDNIVVNIRERRIEDARRTNTSASGLGRDEILAGLRGDNLDDEVEAEIERAEFEARVAESLPEQRTALLTRHAEQMRRELINMNADQRREVVSIALGDQLGTVLRDQESETLIVASPRTLTAVQTLPLPNPAPSSAVRAEYAEILREKLATLDITDETEQAIFAELALRGHHGPGFGSIPAVGTNLIEQHVISFEFVALIILAGCLGAAVLARRRSPEEEAIVGSDAQASTSTDA